MMIAQNHLVEQVDEMLCATTEWPDLAGELDVDAYLARDGYPDWHAGTPFRPMFLAYLWAIVEDYPLSSVPDHLRDHPELAEAFGFDSDDIPSESTFRPVRLNNRFDDLSSLLKRTGEEIRQLGAERGAPIGYDLGTTTDESEKDSEPSKRTIQRMLRRNGREVLDEIRSVVIPSFSLPRLDDPIYSKEELLTLETLATLTNTAANSAGTIFADSKNPTPGLDDALNTDGPSGETLLGAITKRSVDEIAEEINFALEKTYTRAKSRLNDLDNLAKSTMIAIDVTYVGYYGDRDYMEWVQGLPDKNEKPYDWCHKFATAIIVGENIHYTIGVVPLGSVEYAANHAYPGADQSYYRGDVVRKLLNIASKFVGIQTVYADREFHAADTISALDDSAVKYVIPAKKDKRVRRICERFDQLKNGYADEKRDTELLVKDDYAMYGDVKGQVSNTRVESTLVVLPPNEDDEVHERDSAQPFLTNVYASDVIALDRRETKKRIERYRNRGAIENSYSSIKEYSSWTTSKQFEVRWFHFGFACIIYNLWLLTDFLVQERIGVIETRMKPRITLKRFLRWLDRALERAL